MDFGLALELGGTGEADWALENGLLRTCPVFEAMLGACTQGRCDWGRRATSSHKANGKVSSLDAGVLEKW